MCCIVIKAVKSYFLCLQKMAKTRYVTLKNAEIESRCNMKEFIEKLIGRLEEKRSKYIYDQEALRSCKRVRLSEFCAHKVKAYDEVLSIVNQLAEEYKDINIITDFLQYVRDNADNYDVDNGWDLSDLIDLSIKFCDTEEHNGG